MTPTMPASTGHTAIYTIHVGNAPYAKSTLPSIQQYAQKTHSTFTVLDAPNSNYPSQHFLFFDAIEHFLKSECKQMLYVDLDIIINNTAPNIFAEFAHADIAISPDRLSDRSSTKYVQEWLPKHFVNYDIKSLAQRTYFNTGVVLLSKEGAKHLHVALQQFLEEHTYLAGAGEQHLVNWLIAHSPLSDKIVELPEAWNKCGSRPFLLQNIDRCQDILSAYFVHFAGGKNNKSRECLENIELFYSAQKTAAATMPL